MGGLSNIPDKRGSSARSLRRGGRGGFTFVEIIVVVAVLTVLAALGISFWMGTYAKRFFNTVALTDVANTARALDGLSDDTQFSLTITGPGSVPGLDGARVSKGTTLFVRRLKEGDSLMSYVRGENTRGTTTYYFENGSFYAENKEL